MNPLEAAAEYRSWMAMTARCLSPRSTSYPRYGGRGILVCDRWQGPEGYAHFREDMGPKPTPEHSIERKDNNGNYEPSNCRWATRYEQRRNASNVIFVFMEDVRMCLKDACAVLGVSYSRVVRLVRNGTLPADALRAPSRANTKSIGPDGLSMREAARRAGIDYQTFVTRLNRGLSYNEAVRRDHCAWHGREIKSVR